MYIQFHSHLFIHTYIGFTDSLTDYILLSSALALSDTNYTHTSTYIILLPIQCHNYINLFKNFFEFDYIC